MECREGGSGRRERESEVEEGIDKGRKIGVDSQGEKEREGERRMAAKRGWSDTAFFQSSRYMIVDYHSVHLCVCVCVIVHMPVCVCVCVRQCLVELGLIRGYSFIQAAVWIKQTSRLAHH